MCDFSFVLTLMGFLPQGCRTAGIGNDRCPKVFKTFQAIFNELAL